VGKLGIFDFLFRYAIINISINRSGRITMLFKAIIVLVSIGLCSLTGCIDYEDARVKQERVQALIAETEALERESAAYAEEAADALEEQALQAPSDNP